jgi:hypothetical protein
MPEDTARDPFVIRIAKPKRTRNNSIVRISPESCLTVFQLTTQTGLPMGKIVDMMIAFAAERLQIVEE